MAVNKLKTTLKMEVYATLLTFQQLTQVAYRRKPNNNYSQEYSSMLNQFTTIFGLEDINISN